MYIDILVLSHLVDHPTHGYELRQRVETSTGFRMHNNALYPALRRFEESGAVVKAAVPQQGHPPRHVYELTELGREMLHDLLVDFPPELAGSEAEFLVRVGYFGFLTPAERRSILSVRQQALDRQAKHLGTLADQDGITVWGRRVVEELLRRVDRELGWLQQLREQAGDSSSTWTRSPPAVPEKSLATTVVRGEPGTGIRTLARSFPWVTGMVGLLVAVSATLHTVLSIRVAYLQRGGYDSRLSEMVWIGWTSFVLGVIMVLGARALRRGAATAFWWCTGAAAVFLVCTVILAPVQPGFYAGLPIYGGYLLLAAVVRPDLTRRPPATPQKDHLIPAPRTQVQVAHDDSAHDLQASTPATSCPGR